MKSTHTIQLLLSGAGSLVLYCTGNTMCSAQDTVGVPITPVAPTETLRPGVVVTPDTPTSGSTTTYTTTTSTVQETSKVHHHHHHSVVGDTLGVTGKAVRTTIELPGKAVKETFKILF